MAFKGIITLFAVGRKFQKHKVLCKKSLDFSFKSGFKRPRFTGIITGG
jgi:hypothetical protein